MPRAINPYRGGNRRILPDEECAHCRNIFRPKNRNPAKMRFCSWKCRVDSKFKPWSAGLNFKKRTKKCKICKKLITSTWCKKNRYCSVVCSGIGKRNKKFTLKARKNMSAAQKELWKNKKMVGWRAFIKQIRSGVASLEWKAKIFIYDKRTCVTCGYKGQHIQADHLLPLAAFPQYAYDLNNGVTLCIDCHKKTETWGNSLGKNPYFKENWLRARKLYKEGKLELNKNIRYNSVDWLKMWEIKLRRKPCLRERLLNVAMKT